MCGSSLVAQQVKDLALSLLWLRFNLWPRNFHRQRQEKKKKKDKCVNGKVNKVWPGALALKQLWAQRGWGTVRTQPDITPSPAPSHQGHTLPEPLWSWLESCLPSQIPRAHCPAPVGQAHGTWKMHILRKR